MNARADFLHAIIAPPVRLVDPPETGEDQRPDVLPAIAEKLREANATHNWRLVREALALAEVSA